MVKRFKVAYYLRPDRKNEEGKMPIMVRISLSGDRLSLGTSGHYTLLENWDSVNNRVKGRSREAAQINSDLERIETDLQYLYRRMEFSENLSLENIRDEYTGKKTNSASFLEFFDEFLEKVKSEIGKERCYASYQKFNVLKKHFIAFLNKRFGKRTLKMSELSYKHISEFENYLLTDGKCCHNTVMRMMGNLKTITIRAFKLGLLEKDPYVNYKIRFHKVDRGFLTEEEIMRMMDMKFSIKRLEQVRDIFIFSCFTGLAYIDMTQLTPDNIVMIDGRKWIMTKRQKTNVPSNILLLDVPAALIKKYKGKTPDGRLLPIPSNQKLNAYLKEIADLCNIEKKLTFHLARHTFATLAITKGVPIESLSKMLGHTKIQTTQLYGRIINKKIEEDMSAFADKISDFSSMNL